MIKFNRKTILTVLILIAVLYVGTYLAMTFNTSYKVAKDYIESNEHVVEAIGPVKYSFIKIFGHSSARTNEAQYEISVSGDKTGLVFLKMSNAEGWKVSSATLTTDENKVIILKEEAK